MAPKAWGPGESTYQSLSSWERKDFYQYHIYFFIIVWIKKLRTRNDRDHSVSWASSWITTSWQKSLRILFLIQFDSNFILHF